jgi:2-phosphosulfolactate phosphatase
MLYMQEMLFEVAFMPKDVKENSSSVCVIIDVIRASTTITHLLKKGCAEIVLTNDERVTMQENPSYRNGGTVICAEQISGDAAEGADFSPSLMAVDEVDVGDRRVVMRTTNGTVAIHTLQERGVKHIFVGCMNNAEAVMREAVLLAKELETSVMIVSAGRDSTRIAALDDAYCAAELLKYGKQIAEGNDMTPVVADSGVIASSLLLAYQDATDAFLQSASGAVMQRIHCEKDIFTCALKNTTDIVGKVSIDEDNIVIKKVKKVIFS